jgi:hypothetical protein
MIHNERFSHTPILSSDFMHVDIPGGATGGMLCTRNASSAPFSCLHPNTWSGQIPLLLPGNKVSLPYMFCESTLLEGGSVILWPATCHVRVQNECFPPDACSLFSPFKGWRANYDYYYVTIGAVLATMLCIAIDLLANVISAIFYL